MKTITTLFTFLFLSIFAVPQAKASQLYLSTSNGTFTKVNLSGDVFISHDGQVALDQVRPGYHMLTVIQKMRNGRGHHHHHRRHNPQRNRNRVIYQGGINIPARSTVYARVNRRGDLIIDQIIRHNPPRQKVRRGKHVPRKGQGTNRGRVSNYSFDDLLIDLERSSFDSEKMRLAKDFIRTNDVYSQDVLDIMYTFSFESNKLSFAKFAYDRTLDPDNYFIVEEAFEFRSSKQQLRKFLR